MESKSESEPNPRPSYFKLDSECKPVKSGGDKRIGSSSEKGKEVDMGVIYRYLTKDRQKYEHEFNYFMAACKEVMTLAKEEGILVEAKPILDDIDDLVDAFRNPPLPGRKIELSVVKAIVPGISPDKMERIMMDVDKMWSKSLFPLVTKRDSDVHSHLSHLSVRDPSIWNVVQVQAVMNLPSSLVPTRYFEFLRYRKRIEPLLYVIVDFSSSQFASSSAKSNCIRRPSGVIIRANTGEPEGCEIIWIENMEVDETRENMYSAIINSNLAFGAQRCINTLLQNLKRDKSSFTNKRSCNDCSITVAPSARSFLLAITEAMKRFFMECVSQRPNKKLLALRTKAEDRIRILHNKTMKDDLAFVGVTSFRVQANPLSVFQWLMKKDMEIEYRMFESDSETDEADDVPSASESETDDKVHEGPEQTDEETDKVHEGPEQTDEETDKVHENPEQTDEETDKVHENPEQTDKVHENPEQTDEETDKVHENPEQTDEETDKVHENPEQTDEEHEEHNPVVTLVTDDKTNIISLHRVKVSEKNAYILQEASMDEHCSFIISKVMNDETVQNHVILGMKSKYDLRDIKTAKLTHTGFAIMPDGPTGLECDACLVTFFTQIYYDKGANVSVESVKKDFVNDLNDVILELNEEVVEEEAKMTELF